MKAHSKMLPSVFLSKRQRDPREASSSRKERIFSYDCDIICLPANYLHDGSGTIKIPRKGSEREFLATNGLIGKIHLSSEMSENEIKSEIR